MGKAIVIFLSLFYAIIISAIGATPALFWGLSWANYLSVGAILFSFQIFVGALYNSFLAMKDRIAKTRLESAKSLAESYQQLVIGCAYCGTNNNVPILISESNKFDCHACKQKNSVLLSWATARTTDAIMPKAESAKIFKSID